MTWVVLREVGLMSMRTVSEAGVGHRRRKLPDYKATHDHSSAQKPSGLGNEDEGGERIRTDDHTSAFGSIVKLI